MNDITKTPDVDSNSSEHQRQRIRSYLQTHGSCTTAYARDYLDIQAPAARVFELRHNEGLNIVSVWTTDVTAQGKKHRFVNYILKSGKFMEVANDD